jgi:hypothetical protein
MMTMITINGASGDDNAIMTIKMIMMLIDEDTA